MCWVGFDNDNRRDSDSLVTELARLNHQRTLHESGGGTRPRARLALECRDILIATSPVTARRRKARNAHGTHSCVRFIPEQGNAGAR
jgi:hypothetical protein